jgi:phosphoribosylanthranilate isomerase
VTNVKICGITTAEALAAAADADFVGFVFYAKSPRALTASAATPLALAAASRLKKVGLFVDPDNMQLEQILSSVKLDMIQLHGNENPDRVRDIAARTKLPVVKAVRVATAADVQKARSYESVAQWLLFDAKVEGQQGGTGRAFDWSLLKGFRSPLPWMLSGGLNAANVGAALSVLAPNAVDVSSGVETAPGKKDPSLIREFIEIVKGRQDSISSGAR